MNCCIRWTVACEQAREQENVCHHIVNLYSPPSLLIPWRQSPSLALSTLSFPSPWTVSHPSHVTVSSPYLHYVSLSTLICSLPLYISSPPPPSFSLSLYRSLPPSPVVSLFSRSSPTPYIRLSSLYCHKSVISTRPPTLLSHDLLYIAPSPPLSLPLPPTLHLSFNLLSPTLSTLHSLICSHSLMLPLSLSLPFLDWSHSLSGLNIISHLSLCSQRNSLPLPGSLLTKDPPFQIWPPLSLRLSLVVFRLSQHVRFRRAADFEQLNSIFLGYMQKHQNWSLKEQETQIRLLKWFDVSKLKDAGYRPVDADRVCASVSEPSVECSRTRSVRICVCVCVCVCLWPSLSPSLSLARHRQNTRVTRVAQRFHSQLTVVRATSCVCVFVCS